MREASPHVPPEFTVIIPTRGDSPFLRAALRSALRDDVDLELLLVHDRKPGVERLPEELGRDPRVAILESSATGPAATRNTGLEAARGKWIALLDDDDLWLPGHLEGAREMLSRYPDAVLVAGDAFLLEDDSPDGGAPLPDDPTGLPRFDPGIGEGPIGLRQMLLANRILTPTVVLVRERLEEEDRFSPRLSVMEDYDLWLRLARRHPLIFDPRPSTVVRKRGDSASRDLRKMAREGLEVVARFREGGMPPGSLSDVELRERLGRLWHDLAYACLIEDDAPAARRALRESAARLPFNLKNYIYFLVGALPSALRRRLFARGGRLEPTTFDRGAVDRGREVRGSADSP
jgi:glycosyltransferase involved in cell wall biosynthesis